MGLPPLTVGGLAELNASNLPPSQLFENLSKYEGQAALIAASYSSPETGSTNPELLSLFYSSFFFSHLLSQQKPEARALTQRMPQILQQQDPTVQNCLALLQALWRTEHAQVFHILGTSSWPEAIRPLVQRYERFFQDQSLIAVSTSYQAIRLEVAANYLGLDQQAAAQGDPSIVQRFTEFGWRWDPETRLLHPTPISVPTTDKQSGHGIRDTMAMLGSRSN